MSGSCYVVHTYFKEIDSFKSPFGHCLPFRYFCRPPALPFAGTSASSVELLEYKCPLVSGRDDDSSTKDR
ncbi:MAG: hypothetical protein JNM19_12135 [Chitinophagaceae bacterium]|nr:hypothetical protein [Chitinophagaceae bacterium]